jgi:flagellar protein FlaJ
MESKLKKYISDQKDLIEELEKATKNLKDVEEEEGKKMIQSHISEVKKEIFQNNLKIKEEIEEIKSSKPLKKGYKKKTEKNPGVEKKALRSRGGKVFSFREILPKGLEKETVSRLRKKEEEEKKKKKDQEKERSAYAKISSRIFAKFSRRLLTKKAFMNMQEELLKANLNFTPAGYVSIILMTTSISILVAGFLFLFFLFFSFNATLPIITRATETINERFIDVFWILFAVPLATFFMMYIYPSLEKKSAEYRIDTELPFATIHMAAISGSMINPIKIFEIIISTNEYPELEKEFKKMINEINLYGYDLVSALKNTADNSPSKKLADLLRSLATTISSGGDLPKFFDKRAQTLLFNYRIEQEKASKAAETSMDIYISLMIASPMILMLLMMIMKISGLGIAMSIMTISLIIILGVIILNIIFLVFLQLKRRR